MENVVVPALPVYSFDRKWSDSILPQVIPILRQHINQIVKFSLAPLDKDIHEATDIVLNVKNAQIGVRTRRDHYSFRDLTIRSKRDNGTKTELAKIKEGFLKWYFYGWTEGNLLTEYIIVDMDNVRKNVLWEGKRNIPNGDGTWFIGIPNAELFKCSCLVAYLLKRGIDKDS